jgi:Skp family chaperone for outer membrane proteins
MLLLVVLAAMAARAAVAVVGVFSAQVVLQQVDKAATEVQVHFHQTIRQVQVAVLLLLGRL